jgi:hypothetical protein
MSAAGRGTIPELIKTIGDHVRDDVMIGSR